MNDESDSYDCAALPSPKAPMAVARALAAEFVHDDQFTLRRWRGGWMQWRTTHWAEVEDAEIRARLYAKVEHAVYFDDQKREYVDWAPNRYKIGDLTDAHSAVLHLSNHINPPVWLDGTASPRPAGDLIACANGIVALDERVLLAANPRHFTLVSVPFGYDPHAPAPRQWFTFLGELWPDDVDQIAVLQEWFGYVISGRTDLHKILLCVGPTRAGKGVIARVLKALIGPANVTGPTLASMATNFGLQDLIGKPLATISDARLPSGHVVGPVVERLLSISGEDTITVDRKYRDPWTGQLPTRVMVMTNELPRLGDASAAIAGRFVTLILDESFLGREDPTLTRKLVTELPGILNWALEGLDRLTEQGAFTEADASREAFIALQDLASPVAAFIRDRCVVGPDDVLVDELWKAWREWCDGNGQHPGTKQVFGRNLRARIPRLRMDRPRGGDDRFRRYVGLSLRSAS